MHMHVHANLGSANEEGEGKKKRAMSALLITLRCAAMVSVPLSHPLVQILSPLSFLLSFVLPVVLGFVSSPHSIPVCRVRIRAPACLARFPARPLARRSLSGASCLSLYLFLWGFGRSELFATPSFGYACRQTNKQNKTTNRYDVVFCYPTSKYICLMATKW